LGVLEEQLYQYLFNNLATLEQENVSKFFLVPIGLPGMGKTTLSRFLSATSQSYFNERFNKQIMAMHSKNNAFPKIQNFSKRAAFESHQLINEKPS